jgi:DNA-binding transcriptional ArsR family regulator
MKTKETEKILKALANQRRLAILAYLNKSKTASVGDVADKINLSFKATSKHLGILYSVGLVEREQISLTMIYRLATPINSILKYLLSNL